MLVHKISSLNVFIKSLFKKKNYRKKAYRIHTPVSYWCCVRWASGKQQACWLRAVDEWPVHGVPGMRTAGSAGSSPLPGAPPCCSAARGAPRFAQRGRAEPLRSVHEPTEPAQQAPSLVPRAGGDCQSSFQLSNLHFCLVFVLFSLRVSWRLCSP